MTSSAAPLRAARLTSSVHAAAIPSCARSRDYSEEPRGRLLRRGRYDDPQFSALPGLVRAERVNRLCRKHPETTWRKGAVRRSRSPTLALAPALPGVLVIAKLAGRRRSASTERARDSSKAAAKPLPAPSAKGPRRTAPLGSPAAVASQSPDCSASNGPEVR